MRTFLSIKAKSFLLFISIAMLSFFSTKAQNDSKIEQCGTDIYHKIKLQENPNYGQNVAQTESNVQAWIAKHKQKFKQKGNNKLVIPVVFHNVYNKDSAATQKLEKSKFLEQIEILNRDFNKQNLNRNQTRPVFDSIAESMEVVFTLAHTDPDGNPSEGITYTETDVVGFDLLPFGGGYVNIDSLKSTNGGGKDAWIGDYLNIWVGRISIFTTEGILGIATFPRSAPSNEIAGNPPPEIRLEGISILPRVVGVTLNSAGDTLFSGRTLTHEIGHFFGLRHIWGDDTMNPCNATDFVDDTPVATDNAQQLCNLNLNECSNESAFWAGTNPPNNIENYMDYSGDLCYTMFTRGQVERMTGFVNVDRTPLWDSSSVGGKDPTQFKSWAYTKATNCPNTCDGSITLNVEQNKGNIQFFIDNVKVDSNVQNNICSGIHNVMLIDDEKDTIIYDVYVAPGRYIAPDFDATSTNATCSTCADGKAKVDINNGKAPFTITWNTTPPVTADSLDNLLPGIYTFDISDACGETTRDSVEVTFAVGIENLQVSEINIAPNPVNSTLNISLSKIQNVNTILIYDALGSLVKSIKRLVANNKYTVDVNELEKGSYIIQLTDRNGGIFNNRFVKI